MRIHNFLFILPTTFIRHHYIISTTTAIHNNMLDQNNVSDLFKQLSDHVVNIGKEKESLMNDNNNNNNLNITTTFDEILQSLNNRFDLYLSSNSNMNASKDEKILDNNNIETNDKNSKKKRKLNDEEEQQHHHNDVDIINNWIKQLDEIQQNMRRIKQEMKKKKNKNDIKNDDDVTYHNLDRIHTIIKQLGRKLLECVDAVKQQQQQSQSQQQPKQSSVVDKKKSRVVVGRSCNNKTNIEESVIDDTDNDNNYPNTVSIYLKRLQEQNKELYKNPPILPLPPAIMFYSDNNKQLYDTSLEPKRNKKTNTLCFLPNEKQFLYYDINGLSTTTSSSNNKKKKASVQEENNRKMVNEIFQQFNPNLTPEEVIRGGSFGGTYFRPIVSAVTNIKYDSKDIIQTTIEPNWITGLNIKTMLTNSTYNESINKYKKKCGGSLGMWESSGWINTIDPYGWFQWYCHFYRGRRTSDDIRQIQRWAALAGTKGRFKNQLLNKIYSSCSKGTKINDITISPVIRQTLFHWGIIITSDIFHNHINNMKKK